jgi:hypothetical protein
MNKNRGRNVMFGEFHSILIGVLLAVAVAQAKPGTAGICCRGTDLAAVRVCLETTADDRAILEETRSLRDRIALSGAVPILAEALKVAVNRD